MSERFGRFGEVAFSTEGPRIPDLVTRSKKSMQTYFDRVSNCCDVEINTRIVNYLEMTARKVPIHTMVVAIRPYAQDIYPLAGSAMATDYTLCYGYTPSIQVLARILAFLESDYDFDEWCGLLANNYLLLEEGFCFMNIQFHTSQEDLIIEKSEAYFKEWFTEQVSIMSRVPDNKLVVIALGKDVGDAINSCHKSLPEHQRKSYRVFTCENPVAIHRRYSPKGLRANYDSDVYGKWKAIQGDSIGFTYGEMDAQYNVFEYPEKAIEAAAQTMAAKYLARRLRKAKIWNYTSKARIPTNSILRNKKMASEVPRMDYKFPSQSEYAMSVLKNIKVALDEARIIVKDSHTKVMDVLGKVGEGEDRNLEECAELLTMAKKILLSCTKYKAMVHLLEAKVPGVSRGITSVPPFIDTKHNPKNMPLVVHEEPKKKSKKKSKKKRQSPTKGSATESDKTAKVTPDMDDDDQKSLTSTGRVSEGEGSDDIDPISGSGDTDPNLMANVGNVPSEDRKRTVKEMEEESDEWANMSAGSGPKTPTYEKKNEQEPSPEKPKKSKKKSVTGEIDLGSGGSESESTNTTSSVTSSKKRKERKKPKKSSKDPDKAKKNKKDSGSAKKKLSGAFLKFDAI